MLEAHRVVIPLRVFLVLPFGVLVVFQTMSLPGQFAYVAQEDPEHAHLRWPATVVTVFWVLCIQVVIDASLVWVNAIVWAIAAGWVVLVGVLLYVGFRVLVVFQTMSLPGQFAYMAQEDPEHAYLRWPATVVTVFWVLRIHMLVMRALLRQATTLRTDMEAVI